MWVFWRSFMRKSRWIFRCCEMWTPNISVPMGCSMKSMSQGIEVTVFLIQEFCLSTMMAKLQLSLRFPVIARDPPLRRSINNSTRPFWGTGSAWFWVGLLSLGLSGCTTIINSVTEDFAGNLSNAILNNPDIATVRDGAPAYLILIDGLVAQSPDNDVLLTQSAQLHSAYAAAFVNDHARSQQMHTKALALAERSVCLGLKKACDLRDRDYVRYENWVGRLRSKDVELSYQLATTWAGWLQAHSDDFNALAELPRVKILMERLLEIAPDHDSGGPSLYMGVFESLAPPALGGRPAVAKAHFERAIAASGGEYLMAKVFYAQLHARLVFDRDLHDRLLEEVLAASPDVPGLTLINSVAQTRAKELLETADDYF